MRRVLAMAWFAIGCGQVASRDPAIDAASTPPDGRPPDGRPPDAAVPGTPYRGTLTQTSPVTFGGPFGGVPYCHYTITLKQLEIDLTVLPSGQVTSGQVQDLNDEEVVQPCTQVPIAQNIATYTLKPGQTGSSLVFLGAASNQPHADLTVELMSAGTAHQAKLGFHRNDQGPPFDWSVVVTLSLSAQ